MKLPCYNKDFGIDMLNTWFGRLVVNKMFYFIILDSCSQINPKSQGR